MEKMNLKKVTPEIREYVRTRILYLKEKNYSIKDIGNLLNINDDYIYQVLKKYRENGSKLPPEKIRGRKFGEGRSLPQIQADEIKKSNNGTHAGLLEVAVFALES